MIRDRFGTVRHGSGRFGTKCRKRRGATRGIPRICRPAKRFTTKFGPVGGAAGELAPTVCQKSGKKWFRLPVSGKAVERMSSPRCPVPSPPFQNAGTSRALAARHHANRRMPPPSSCVLEGVEKEKAQRASGRNSDGLHQREPAIYSGVCAKVRTSSSIVPKIVVFAPQRRSRRSMALNRMRLPS